MDQTIRTASAGIHDHAHDRLGDKEQLANRQDAPQIAVNFTAPEVNRQRPDAGNRQEQHTCAADVVMDELQ